MKINVFSILTLLCSIALIGISGSEAFGQDVNLALKENNPKVTATQSSTSEWVEKNLKGEAKNAIDGNLTGAGLGNIAETQSAADSWFEVDLGGYYKINKIVLYPRNETCCRWFTSGYIIITDQSIGTAGITDESKIKSLSNYWNFLNPVFQDYGDKQGRTVNVDGKIGRFVRVQVTSPQPIQLAEIQILGSPTPIAGNNPDPTKVGTEQPTTGSTSNPSGQINLARNPGVTARQSSVKIYKLTDEKTKVERDVPAGPAEKAIDGNTNGTFWDGTIVETEDGSDGWFEVDLKNNYKINKIIIHPRTDCCRQGLFKSAYVTVTDQEMNKEMKDLPMLDEVRILNSSTFSKYFETLYEVENEKTKKETKEINTDGSVGRFVRLQIKGHGSIELSEIEILGDPTPVATYTPTTKAWAADFEVAFDPNYPNFLAPTKDTEHFNTLRSAPGIVGVKNSNTSFDLAFQLSGKNKIMINNYVEDGKGGFKKTTNSKFFEGLGLFGGFAKDAAGNRYVFSAAPSKYVELKDADGNTVKDKEGNPIMVWTEQVSKLYKNEVSFWDGQFSDLGVLRPVKAFMHEGGSRLAIGKDSTGKESLLITANIAPAHPYQIILDTQNLKNNEGRAFYESYLQHNFGQRAIFDGKDFVVMENRDHDVSVTLSKINPGEKFPIKYKDKSDADLANQNQVDKANMNSLMYTDKIFSVYSHTNFGNHTFTELGNVEKGFDDNGYLVLFASERDWNNKMAGFKPTSEIIKTWSQPQILSPRDIGLVHVKKNFDKEDADPSKERAVNWLNSEGKKTQCPQTVDNSKLVNSTGAAQTITYYTANDGWDWTRYSSGSGCETTNTRSLITKGVKWITSYGAPYESSKTKAAGEFTSVNHPKLVRIDKNKYVVLWEEWKADSVGYGNPKKEYLTTKAALMTLKAAPNGEVNIELTLAPTDLGKVRLMPGDDAFEFDGKAAWAVGDVTKGKLMFYTVDSDLKLTSYALEL